MVFTAKEMIIMVIPQSEGYDVPLAVSRWIFLQLHRRPMTSGSLMIPPHGHGVAPRVAEAAEGSLGVRLVFSLFSM